MKRKGKFIVIDGTDGTGKATQTALLVSRLKKSGHKVKVQDFPRYGQRSAALVEDYLNGRLGTAKELGPYIPSMFYAADRFAASKQLKADLARGNIVVSNRYVTANMGHQGAKITNAAKRQNFFNWLLNLEYNIYKIPKPDTTIILHMPEKVAQKLVEQKNARAYIKRYKKKDLHERDIKHLQAAEKTYLLMAKIYKFAIIECYRNGKILPINEISDLIFEKVNKLL